MLLPNCFILEKEPPLLIGQGEGGLQRQSAHQRKGRNSARVGIEKQVSLLCIIVLGFVL